MSGKMGRFSQRGRRVLILAQEEAERLRHNYIGTEHLLLGLMREEGGVAGRVLRDLGLEQRRVEELVEELTRATARPTATSVELSPGTKRVLELAVDEARRMGHHFIGTEHLVLGLVRQSEGVAIDVLKRLGVRPEEVRRQTRRVLQESPVQTRSVPSTNFTSLPIPAERFTERAARVITLTGEIALKFDHNLIATEHLLLGIMRESHGVGARVLRDLAVMPERVEKLIVELSRASVTPTPTTVDYSSDFKRVLELAADEARRLQTPHRLKEHLIGTEHLLLGLVRHTEGLALEILKRVGVSPEEIRRQTRDILQRSTVQSSTQISPPKPPPAHIDSDYTLIQATIFKLLDMVAEKSLSISQAAELFSALSPHLKLSVIEQTDLIKQLFQTERLQHYKVRIRVTDPSGAEAPGETVLPLTRLLTEIDTFLDIVINKPDTPFIYTQDGFHLEVLIENGEPDDKSTTQ